MFPALSCKEIASSKSGQYWIKPSFNDPPFKVDKNSLNCQITVMLTLVYNRYSVMRVKVGL